MNARLWFMDSTGISDGERERRRKISEAKKGRPRPDLAARNATPEMRAVAARPRTDEARRNLSAARVVHGHARVRGVRQGTPTYYVWGAMIQRCTNAKSRDFKDYGGRGITVCERWRKFANFLHDMGEKPDGLSIDRIDNEGNYEPGNCRWADAITQARNKRAKP